MLRPKRERRRSLTERDGAVLPGVRIECAWLFTSILSRRSAPGHPRIAAQLFWPRPANERPPRPRTIRTAVVGSGIGFGTRPSSSIVLLILYDLPRVVAVVRADLRSLDREVLAVEEGKGQVRGLVGQREGHGCSRVWAGSFRPKSQGQAEPGWPRSTAHCPPCRSHPRGTGSCAISLYPTTDRPLEQALVGDLREEAPRIVSLAAR